MSDFENFLQLSRERNWDKIFFFSHPNQRKGCSSEEINYLERETDLKLPKTYKEFLSYCGYGLGDFSVGSDMFYETDLIELQKDARDLLVENNFRQKLPVDAYVFWMHGGYMFCFFRVSEGNNPPVHFYRESFKDDFAWNYHPHFTEFLIQRMQADAEHRESASQIEERIARDWTRG